MKNKTSHKENKPTEEITKNKGGRPYAYTPEQLTIKIEEYFRHTKDNPIVKKKRETYRGETKEYEEEFIKPYTIEGLCNYLNITMRTFRNWGEVGELIPIITRARQIITEDKLQGSIAGIFNSNIVALDLGLKAREEAAQNNLILSLKPSELKNILGDLTTEYGAIPEASEPQTIDITKESGNL